MQKLHGGTFWNNAWNYSLAPKKGGRRQAAEAGVSTGALAQGGISHRRQKTSMGRAKEQYLLWLEAQAEDASYEEAQSRLRMSTLCTDCVRQPSYPLPARIVELAISAQADSSASAKPRHSAQADSLAHEQR